MDVRKRDGEVYQALSKRQKFKKKISCLRQVNSENMSQKCYSAQSGGCSLCILVFGQEMKVENFNGEMSGWKMIPRTGKQVLV